MRIKAETEVALAPGEAFDALAALPPMEHLARHRALEVVRLDATPPTAEGARWRLAFTLAGRRHAVDVRLAAVARPELLLFESRGEAVAATTRLALAASGHGARLRVVLTPEPRGLAGRVVMQAAHLRRERIEAGLAARLEAYARRLEAQAG
jgi:hypothetical protein